MPWRADLSDDQRTAAAHTGSHARLLAGPGTGKTLTLTRHLLKLALDDQVEPEAILAVTFTRVNAFEFRRAVESEFSAHELGLPRISTLHSFALSQLLHNSAAASALPQPLRIADDFEEQEIIRPDLAEALGLSDRDVRSKFAELSSAWEDLRYAATGFVPPDPAFMRAWLDHRLVYGYTLRSELVWQLKQALDENPESFDFQGPILHLIVDEYQDLNKCDLAVISAIASRGARLYAAGDDDQSIYSFRRAYPEGIRNFQNEFHPSASLGLEICWRSDRKIVTLGEYVARQATNRLPKTIRPRDDAQDGEVHLLRFSNQDAEAAGIASLCTHLLRDRQYRPEEILILLRSDHQGRYSNPIREALQNAGIPVTVRSQRAGPLDGIGGRYLLSLMRLSLNEADDLAWRTLLHLVRKHNHIGSKTVEQLYELAKGRRVRFSEVLTDVEQSPDQLRGGAQIISERNGIRNLMNPLSKVSRPDAQRIDDPLHRATIQLELLQTVERLAESIIPESAELNDVMEYISKAASRWNTLTLDALVKSLTSPENTQDQELDAGKVNILTMHRAKGLSARAVVVIGAETELIPGAATDEAYEDERRLLYVSLTRAKHFLVATYCNERTGRQQHSGSTPGRKGRHLTDFLRGAITPEDGAEFAATIQR